MKKLIFVVLLAICSHGFGQQASVADSLNRLAVAEAQAGNLEGAAEIFFQCYEEAVKEGDSVMQAKATRNLGNVFTYIKDFDKAAKYYGQSLDLGLAIHDTAGTITTFQNMASLFELQGEFGRALEHAQHALALSELKNDSANLSITLHNIGSMYGRMKQSRKALQFYLRALEIQQFRSDSASLALYYTNIGACYHDLGLPRQGLPYHHKALVISRSYGNLDLRRGIYFGLKDCFFQLGMQDSAWHYVDEWMAVKDSMYQAELAGRIEALEVQFQAERKEKENAELKAQNVEKSLALEQRRKWMWGGGGIGLALLLGAAVIFLRQRNSNQQKEMDLIRKQAELEQQVLRARMNPHFLFNSLTNIQHMYLNGRFRAANDFMADFSRLLRKILEHTGKREITVSEELTTLRLYMELERDRLEGKMDFDIQIEEGIDLADLLMPPMLLQPFVENAIWHGIVPKGEGSVKVSLKLPHPDLLEVRIEDDGVGLTHSKAPSRPQHKSASIALTKERLGAKGRVDLREIPTGGTVVSLHIPVQYAY